MRTHRPLSGECERTYDASGTPRCVCPRGRAAQPDGGPITDEHTASRTRTGSTQQPLYSPIFPDRPFARTPTRPWPHLLSHTATSGVVPQAEVIGPQGRCVPPAHCRRDGRMLRNASCHWATADRRKTHTAQGQAPNARSNASPGRASLDGPTAARRGRTTPGWKGVVRRGPVLGHMCVYSPPTPPPPPSACGTQCQVTLTSPKRQNATAAHQ